MLFQSTGLYLLHTVQVGLVRHEMKQRIKAGVPEEDLVVLKITKSEEENPQVFERKHSREFLYKGEMYDVMRSSQVGDTTIYTCIHDVKESRLFARLDRMVLDELNGNENQKKHREMMLGFFQKVYLSSVSPALIFFPPEIESLFGYSDSYSEKHSLDPVEPPRCMLFC